jgi:hypothetical protein
MDTIPPPRFQTDSCVVHCCICGSDCVLYWLRDDVWARVQPAAQCCGGHACVSCAEVQLGRQLTLADLAIEKYRLTAKNEPPNAPGVIHCVVDTVMGAAFETGVMTPTNWCTMWQPYVELGRKLALQTPAARNVVVELIDRTREHFPNFTNPYDRGLFVRPT